MDPRHPEQAISRMRELIKQYDRVEKDMSMATTSAQLAQLEREGGLVVQEICLVAPRIHEAMMQTSRQRRHDLARGVLVEPQDTAVEAPRFIPDNEVQTVGYMVEEPVEKSVEKSQEKCDETEVKPKKKTTRKKKTTKKAEK